MRLLLCVAVAIVSLLAGIAGFRGQWLEQGIAIETPHRDLGRIVCGAECVVYFTFRNLTDHQVRIVGSGFI